MSDPRPQTVPQRYLPAVIPHVVVDDADQAIKSYREAFLARELFRITGPDGRIIHAELAIGGSTLMIGDPVEPFAASGGRPCVGLHVYVDDVDEVAARAGEIDGYDVLQPPTDQFYGDRTVMIGDPFGLVWVFLTHREDLEPEEIERRARELFGP